MIGLQRKFLLNEDIFSLARYRYRIRIRDGASFRRRGNGRVSTNSSSTFNHNLIQGPWFCFNKSLPNPGILNYAILARCFPTASALGWKVSSFHAAWNNEVMPFFQKRDILKRWHFWGLGALEDLSGSQDRGCVMPISQILEQSVGSRVEEDLHNKRPLCKPSTNFIII